jgi:hypothetical protein
MLESRAELSRRHFDDRLAVGAHRMMVRSGGHPVGGDPAIEGQRVQDALIDQRGHRAVDGRKVGRLNTGGQARRQPVADLGDRQVPVDGLDHRQYLDPRRHPAQPSRT